MRLCSERGQSTVEAAFLAPVLLALLGLLLQPAALLYTRGVMTAAAAETCRLVQTSNSSSDAVRAYTLRRLGAVPKLSVFHVGGDESWKISWEGGPGESVTVSIAGEARPLPLLGVEAGLLAQRGDGGNVRQQVQVSSTLAPSWLGTAPQDGIGAWE